MYDLEQRISPILRYFTKFDSFAGRLRTSQWLEIIDL